MQKQALDSEELVCQNLQQRAAGPNMEQHGASKHGRTVQLQEWCHGKLCDLAAVNS